MAFALVTHKGFIDGDFTTAMRTSVYRPVNLTDGSGAIEVRASFQQFLANWTKTALNTAGPVVGGLQTYLVEESAPRDVGAGVIEWERVWCSLPSSRSEVLQQMRACIGINRTYVNSQLTDIQLFSVSISTWVTAYYTFALGNGSLSLPADGPAGTVIHSSGNGTTITQLLTFNGFDSTNGTFGIQFNQSWTRRRWRGDIWEQILFVN